MMLEAGLNADNAFVTLTYSDNNIESLEPKHLQAFLKSFRKIIAPLRVRFYAVGEYGEKHGRPHYHLALFGWPDCRQPHKRGYCSCPSCKPISQAWGRGFIVNLPLELASARYVARYTIKKMTRFDDPRLGGRHPEFARMSLRPGIGHGVLRQVAATITRYNLLNSEGDVPVTLAHGGQEHPLGRYLRRKLRLELGLDERAPHFLSAEASFAHANSEQQQELRALQKAAISDPQNPSLKAQVLKASRSIREQTERRYKLFNRKHGEL